MIEDLKEAELQHRDALRLVVSDLTAWLNQKRASFKRSIRNHKARNQVGEVKKAEHGMAVISEVIARLRKLKDTHGERSAKCRMSWYTSQISQGGNLMGPLPDDPTPEDIQAACRKLQDEWTELERQRRAGMEPSEMEFDRTLYPDRVF